MTRPTRHPKTGTYVVRLAIPAELREAAKTLFGVQRELRENLRTKDAREARRLGPDALARLRAKIEQARRIAVEEPQEPIAREIAALAGLWYRQRVGADVADPETEGIRFEIAAELGTDRWPDEEIAAYAPQVAEVLLRQHGYAATPETVMRLAAAISRAAKNFKEIVKRRSEGDWSADTNLGKFPELPAPLASASRNFAGSTFDGLLAGFALDRGWREEAGRVDRALYDRKRTLERFAAFVGHHDAGRVTKADVVRWKEEAFKRGLKAPTVRNDISELSAIWAWGIRNGKLRSAENPFAGTLPPKAKKKGREPRAFTDAEAAAILQAARGQKGFLRWLPWVLCLTGARLNEICQADAADVATVDGVPVIRIHDVGEGRSVKNTESRRTVPLHPALVAEGFLDYVSRLPDGAPLWPDVKPDAVFHQRSVTAGRKIARWLRSDLKLTDPLISPNHSWRHWFIGACRRVVMPIEVRSAITGHSAKMDESAGYGAGMGTFVQVVAGWIAKVACPLDVKQANPAAKPASAEAHPPA